MKLSRRSPAQFDGSTGLSRRLASNFAVWSLFAGIVSGQSGVPATKAAGAGLEEGIPVTDPVVIAKCGKCHARDARGNMQRISWARTTPEGWQNALKRMVLVNGVSLTAPEARLIVRYLSTSHGLAPEEAQPVMYSAERRIHEETNIPDNNLRSACAKCHAFALPLSWRRSLYDWKQFIDSHAVRHMFPPSAEAVAFLAKAAPLHTPEWEAWSARTNLPNLAGRWLVTASMPGRGKYYGEMQVDRAGDDEFATRVNLTSVINGSKVLRTGRMAVYGGYAWRGRSGGSDPVGPAPDDLSSEAREVVWIAPDHLTAEGRWFWGQYQELGFNVQLQRASSDPTVMVVDRPSLKAGSRGNRVRVIGDNFPAGATPADLDFGPGVTVRGLVSGTSVEIVADVDVAADAPLGKRGLALRRSVLPGAIAIYDRVDYVKLTPESAVAAFADGKHHMGYLQFEAIGYQRGADGRMHTADDVDLGPVDVRWSFQVFHAHEGSSADFVGRVNATGLFTPAVENPNNNYDCWAIATATGEKDQNGAPLVAKAYVVVTVPTYTFNGRRYVRELDRWVDDGPA
jgi:quinohemoprotein amine dehydrogenase